MKHLIVANWKMNPESAKNAKQLFNAVKKNAKSKNAKVVICPPFVYLPLLKGMTLGAQNIFFEDKGAFTGEISAWQLKDLNVEYVIIGHSERRKYFGETDEIINKKIKKALEVGLKVIFCIGENEGEDKATVLEKQIIKGLYEISNSQYSISNIVIAYEPVWAIGTGKNCSVEDTVRAAELIKNMVEKLYGKELANDMKILYGGSVNSKNSAEYVKHGGVNGLLVGGASLDAGEFSAIVRSVTE